MTSQPLCSVVPQAGFHPESERWNVLNENDTYCACQIFPCSSLKSSQQLKDEVTSKNSNLLWAASVKMQSIGGGICPLNHEDIVA